MKFILWLLVILALTSCATKELRIREYQLAPGTPNPAKPPEEFYVIGYGDVLDIHIWKEPSVSGAAKVRPDGFLTIPLVNEIQVVGMTTAGLRKILVEKYKEFLTNPFITIRVKQIASSEVFLIGQVKKPGVYSYDKNYTLLQLLTRAGGLTIFADLDDIRVVRREGEKLKEFVIDYNAIIAGDLKQDILLRPGDRIIVP